MTQLVPPTPHDHQIFRAHTRGTYDVQQLRIQFGNRIYANFRTKLGIEPGTSAKDAEAKAKKVLDEVSKNYYSIMEGVLSLPRKKADFTSVGVIDDISEFYLVNQYLDLLKTEGMYFKQLEYMLEEWPIWTEFLKNVTGVGRALASVMISEFDPHKADYVSSMWKYAGLDVAPDGRGRSKRKEHQRVIEYIDKNGQPATRMGLTYNPFLKSRLLGVLPKSFLRSKSPYRRFFDTYRARILSMEEHKEKTGKHVQMMAHRYMVKKFISDLWVNWRTLEGLPITDENGDTVELTNSTQA